MVASVRHQVRVASLVLWLLALAAVIAGVFAWVLFARELSRATRVPVAAVPQPNAVVWHKKVFQSQQAMRAELANEGRDYDTWVGNHPAAAALLAALDRHPSTER